MERRPTSRRWRRHVVHGPLWFALWFIAWIGGVSALAALWLSQGVVTLPDIARDAVAGRIGTAVSAAGLEVELGGATLELREGLVPVAEFSGLRLFGEGGDAAVLDHVEAVLDRSELLRGRIAPQALRVSGVALSVARGTDGQLSIRLGESVRLAEGSAPGPVLDRLRDALDQPGFNALRELGVSDLSLRFEDAREGGVWETSGGRLGLTRRGGALELEAALGEIALPGGPVRPGQAELQLDSPARGLPASLTLALRGLVPAQLAGISGTAPLSALLDRIAAPVTLELSATLEPDGALGAMDGRIAVGGGTLVLPGRTAPLALEQASATVSLNAAHDTLRLREMVVEAPELSLAGELDLMARRVAGQPVPLAAQMRFSRLRLDRPDLLPEPVELEFAAADARIAPGGGVRIDGLLLQSGDLTVTGTAGIGAGGEVEAALQTDQMPAGRVMEFWPPHVAPGTRGWLERNLRAGTLRDASFILRRTPGVRPEIGLSFEFTDGTLRPMQGLPELREAVGRATIDGSEFRLALDSGVMTDPLGGTIDVRDGSVVQPDLALKGATLRIVLSAEASTGGLLALVRLPAFRPPDAPEPEGPGMLPSAAATGTVALDLSLGIPLKPGLNVAALDYAATGTLDGFTSDTLVGARPLRAGTLRLSADPTALVVSGPVTLDGQEMTAEFRRPLDAPDAGAEVRAEGPLTLALLESFGVRLPPRSVSGAGRFEAVVTLSPDAPPRLSASGSLAGMALSVPALGWSKPAGSAGSAEIAGRLGPGGALDPVLLSAPGLNVEGRVALPAAPGGVPRLSIERLQAGGWLTTSVSFPAPGRVALSGGTLDLRRRPPGLGEGGGGVLQVALDRVQVSEGIVLEQVRGTLTGGRGTITALVGGRAPVEIELAGGTIRVTGDDAGRILRGAGLSQQVRGGSLDLRLSPRGEGFRGQLRITDTAVRDTPVMAELLAGLSVVGAVEQMAGAGIVFEDVRADFVLSPRRLTVQSASATGPSLGLSLNGVVALDSGALNLEGVVSPLYFLNRAGSFMTRRGEGLIGISFTLRGNRTAPRLDMNPLSVLTPGFLRDIFRTDPGTAPGQ